MRCAYTWPLDAAHGAKRLARLPQDSLRTVFSACLHLSTFLAGPAACLRGSYPVRGPGQHPVMLAGDRHTPCRTVISLLSLCPARSLSVGGAAHRLKAVAFISNLDHRDFPLIPCSSFLQPWICIKSWVKTSLIPG